MLPAGDPACSCPVHAEQLSKFVNRVGVGSKGLLYRGVAGLVTRGNCF